MRRIIIVGSGGSGKSTLARDLGRRLGLPVHHLDRFYWKAGWEATPDPEWIAIQQRLCSEPQWIIEGNYGATMDLRLAAADAVIFLDLSTGVCLRSVVRRFLRYRGGTRPDMTEGCPEQLTFEYVWWILTFRAKRRPRLLRKLQHLEQEKRVVILKSRESVNAFVSESQGSSSTPANSR